jgi:hypothetical protein
LVQVWFDAHTTPQPPQLLRSNRVFEQVAPQRVSPFAQVHMPEMQPTWAAVPGQTTPQPPQLLRSLFRSRQLPVQLVWPTPHAQDPAVQKKPGLQVMPQAPQLFRSVWRLRHTPWHCALPPVQ